MAWKSREDKLPPASFFAGIIPYLQRAYPGATLSREVMEALRPYFVEAWRNGKGIEAAAQTTCSCDGRQIVPSPVIGVQIAKGTVRPPRGAQRGEVFGAEELREPAPVERLQKRLQRITREQEQVKSIEARWEQRARTARKDATRSEAEQKQSQAVSRYAGLMKEAQSIEGEIRRLRSELSRPRRIAPLEQREPAIRVPALPPAPPPPPPTPPPSAAPPAPPPAAKANGRPKKKGAKPGPAAASPPAASPPEGEDAALLGAIKGMLPGIASQLAAQMAKDDGGRT